MALACGARVAIAWRADTPLFVSENDVSENENAETVETCFSTEPRVCVGDIARLHSPVGARVTAELKSERRGASSSVRLVIPGAPTSPATRARRGARRRRLRGARRGRWRGGARRGDGDRALRRRRGGVARGRVGPSADLAPGVVRCESVAPDARAEEETETIFEDSPRGEAAVSDADDDDDDAWEYLLRSARHASDASRYPSLAAAAASESARTSNAARAGRRKTPKSAEKRVPAASPTPRSERAAPVCPRRTSRAPWLCCARRTRRTRRASWMSCFGRVSWTSAASASVRQSRARRSSPRRTRRARASPPRRRRSGPPRQGRLVRRRVASD